MPRARIAILLAVSTVLVSCTSSHRQAQRPSPTPSPLPPLPAGAMVIVAAPGLKPAFDPLVAAFQSANPGVSPTVVYQGTQSAATAILNGLQADVFAATDPSVMGALTATADSPVTGTAVAFARDDLQIALPTGNPKGIQTLADLAKPGTSVVLANPTLPEGRDAGTALAQAGVKPAALSVQSSVGLVLTTLLSGRADASILYRSDIASAGSNVTAAVIPAPDDVVVSYLIAVLRTGSNAPSGKGFVRFVLSDAGRSILTGAGLLPP